MGIKISLVATAVLLTVGMFHSPATGETNPQSKIDPPAQAALESKRAKVDVLVECQNSPGINKAVEKILAEISDLVATTPTREGRGGDVLTGMVNDAQAITLKSLREPIELLTKLGVEFDVFWRINVIFIRDATLELILKIAESQVVTLIRLPRTVPIPPLPKATPPPRPTPTGNSTWEIGLIDARCSSIPCLGTNVVVGIIDTGTMWNHYELVDNWRGENQYSWLDGVYKTTSAFPHDKDGHGTFTASMAVGKSVGVAPHALWIACASYSDDLENTIDHGLYKCMDFMACPYLWNDYTVDKVSKNCAMRPQVINNSWETDTTYIQPSDDPFFAMLQYWNSLGIISVFAAGNAGPSCSSVGFPAGYSIATSVGAVDSAGTIAWSSSRGPAVVTEGLPPNSTATGTCNLPPSVIANSSPICLQNKPKGICRFTKPDILGPGVNVNGSWVPGTTDYHVGSGTSAASPLVAGVMALMICARSDLHWNHMLAYKFLTETADTSWLDLTGDKSSAASFAKPSNILCNVFVDGFCQKWPNNVYGWGLVWACKAVEAVLAYIPTP